MEQENKKIKILKRILIVLLIIIFICVIATIGIGNYFVNYAILRTGNGGDREVKNEDIIEVASIDNESEKIIEKNRKKEKELAEKWTENISNTKVEIKANDGIKLRGTEYVLNEQNNKWANCAKDKLIIHNAGHTEAKYKEQETYYNKIFDFIK